MYCPVCGKEISDEAVVCTGCGCMVQDQNRSNETTINETSKKSNVSLILGLVGIVFAWLFALVGHITSIIGIIIGIKEYKQTGKMTGLTVSIIGEIW